MPSDEPSEATGTSGRRLRVLHLEDNAADRELVQRALADAGLECEFVHAGSNAEFAAALAGGTFDLILSDFSIPGYDGTAALALVQEKCPAVPYLFVSGTIGEERAIESLKSGATDYVLKNRLERLLPAVQRALRESAERARRKNAEEALRQSEERFREMAGRIEDVFWLAAPNGLDWLYVSPAYERIWGRTLVELHAQPEQWINAVAAEDREAVAQARAQLAEGREFRIEYRLARPDGTIRWVDERGYPVRAADGTIKRTVGVAMDITQRKQLESHLAQSQKMEALGQLAGGVAHDFNNVLTVIVGYSRLLLDQGGLPPEMAEPLTQIYTAGTRASNLTRQLLLFSRKQPAERRVFDLNHAVGDMAKMLERLIGEHIALKLEPAAEPMAVEGDAGMIEQVLMNLAVNARDAMAGGGTLTIGVEKLAIERPEARRHPAARAGEFACVSVCDTGCGIPPEILGRIFEPFFTTKGPARGTGLGLATVFGIVQQHQGWVEVESAVGAGTSFRVLLPASAAVVAPAPRRAARPAVVNGGSETVLLVEDEPTVREYAVAVLRGHGYRVLQAASGVEALETWKWHRERISLLFTDVVLPDGLSGVDLIARLREEKPMLRLVLTSGYPDEADGAGFTPPPGTHFIHKPYRPQVLAQTVRDALDGVFHT
jgi:PAS domain S-box-containing protein